MYENLNTEIILNCSSGIKKPSDFILAIDMYVPHKVGIMHVDVSLKTSVLSTIPPMLPLPSRET